MSITDDKRSGLKRDPDSRTSATGRPLHRRPVVLGAAGVVLALLAGGAFWGLQNRGPAPISAPPAQTPITWPETIDGLPAAPLASDFGTQPIWQERAKAASGGAVVSGRSYGSPKLRRQIRTVAGRADLTGKLEFAWAADAGKAVESSLGTAHCTQNLILAVGSPASVRPTMMLCWRVSPTLSAYAAVIDFDHHPVVADGMKALNATWNAALIGR